MLVILLIFHALYSQVLNLTSLNNYLPGSSPPKELKEFRLKGYPFFKSNILHLAYKFPIYLSINNNLISDFYLPLPSFLSHDRLYEELLKTYGKPNYQKNGSNAIYFWKIDDLTHIYSSTCTLTCFPLFYTVIGTSTNSFFLIKNTQPLDFLK